MRVCDHCHNIHKPVVELKLAIIKPDPSSGRVKPDELKTVPMELCQDCIGIVWSSVEDSLKVVFAPPKPGQ